MLRIKYFFELIPGDHTVAKLDPKLDATNEHKVRQDKLENLQNSGWERRTIMDEPRLSELIAL